MIEFGRPHRHLSECTSTNDIAREWASDPAAPAPSGALVTADFQTRGRGQRGHEWQAASGQSALMSYVYHLMPDTNPAHLGLVTALAAAEALAALGVTPQIKWPNDILIQNKKCGGILVEVSAGTAVLGLGLNVNQEGFPGGNQFVYPPTSLRLAAGQEQSVVGVVEAVGEALSVGEERWRKDGFAAVLERCRDRLAFGAAVRQGEATAELVGLTEEGAAQVKLSDGTFAVWTTVN